MRKIPKDIKRKQVYIALRPVYIRMLEAIPEDRDFLYDRTKTGRRSERVEAALLEHFRTHFPALWESIQKEAGDDRAL